MTEYQWAHRAGDALDTAYRRRAHARADELSFPMESVSGCGSMTVGVAMAMGRGLWAFTVQYLAGIQHLKGVGSQ
jgi:hypothetical protein